MAACPTQLDEIVHRKIRHLGFYDNSGLGAGGVWLDPDRSGRNLVCHQPWPPDIIVDLFLSTNIEVKITTLTLSYLPLLFMRQPSWRQYPPHLLQPLGLRPQDLEGCASVRACACTRVHVGPPFPLQVLVDSATLPAKGIRVLYVAQ